VRIAALTSPAGSGYAAVWSEEGAAAGPVPEIAAHVARIECAEGPVRWVVWSAREVASLLDHAAAPARIWDCTEVHRLRHGGWEAPVQEVWCSATGIDPGGAPRPARHDLFDFGEPGDDGGTPDGASRDSPTTSRGHLRAATLDGGWQVRGLPEDTGPITAWAQAAYEVGRRQQDSLHGRALATAVSESAAAVLCVELERIGLPIDRDAMAALITDSAGPRPLTLEDELAGRAARDREVLRHVRGHDRTDLRNPAQVRALLLAAGIDVPDTRKWTLEAFRQAHPVVPALLGWRAAERIATTYGWRWLDSVGEDDRLRGTWTACDGAAGRMTADNGLHNLPTSLRSAVRASPGHRFVRADLGQIEPRVLAAVSGDPAFTLATHSPDLYAPVAARLGVDRPVAKVAVLAAMYGQRSGAAGEALAGLRRAYPVAMDLLEEAAAAGARNESVRTFGGRLVHTAPASERGRPSPPPVAAARGRFARNAIIQGAAAELFKAWAATIRATTRDLGAEIVLCLHDEVLVHVPVDAADECARRVGTALDDAARRWLGSDRVRFVADIGVIERWSEAKP
jgi:DNA polymerase I